MTDIYGTGPKVDASGIGVPANADAVEQLAALLYETMEHLDPGPDDVSWQSLRDIDREFYRWSVRSLLGRPDLLRAAITSAGSDDGELRRGTEVRK